LTAGSLSRSRFFLFLLDLVSPGMPYIGKHGKRHPIFDLVLVGEKQTTRVRSYRFRTLRVFQEEQVANEPGFYTQRLGGAFPGTLTKSKFGLALSEAELAARVVQLSKWAAELLRVRSAMSPRLRRATLSLLQVVNLASVSLFSDPSAASVSITFFNRSLLG
jgi:hypothetical protein